MTYLDKQDEMLSLIDSFAGRRIMLIGDLVADHYIHGKTSRISREAPVLILKYQDDRVIPGQAGNTAANISALGAQARLIGVIGQDSRGDQLHQALADANVDLDGIVRSSTGATLTKTRILAGGHHTTMQQVIRIDDDDRMQVGPEDVEQIIASINAAADWAEAIIVSDYGYGVVTEETWNLAKEISIRRDLPLVLDSRYELTRWKGATLITPNEEEALAAVGLETGSGSVERSDASSLAHIAQVGERLCRESQCQHLIITRGNEGMALFENGAPPVHLPIFGTKDCTDVTGAGDTVVATATLALAAGGGPTMAMFLSNLAGGLVVMKLGTATTSREEMRSELALMASTA